MLEINILFVMSQIQLKKVNPHNSNTPKSRFGACFGPFGEVCDRKTWRSLDESG